MTDHDLNEALLSELDCHEAVLPLCRRLWQQPGVEALLLFGSFADGSHDEFSDLDLWISVSPDAIESWAQPDLSMLLENRPHGLRTLPSSTGGFVHSIVLEDGFIIDICALPTGSVTIHPPWKVLATRDRQTIEQITTDQLPAPVPASADTVRPLLEGYWLNTLKHHKVLARNDHLACIMGGRLEHGIVLRLWYIADTGFMPGAGSHVGGSLHDMLAQIRHAEQHYPEQTRRMFLHPPSLAIDELHAAIQAVRQDVSAVGRRLADRFGFDYPEHLESAADAEWNRYLRWMV